MRSLGLYLLASSLLLSCESERAPVGTSKAPQPPVSAPAEGPDRSVLGGYFQFLRPPPNLIVKKLPSEGGKQPPPLTGKHVGAVYDLVELSLQVQLTEAQKKALLAAVVVEYEAGGERREGVLSAPLAWASMEQIYKKAPPDKKDEFFQKNREDFVKSLEASPDHPYRRTILEIYRATEEIVVEGSPPLTRQHLDNLLEAVEFLAAVYLGKPFHFLTEDREAIAVALISAYQTLPQPLRDRFAQQARQPDFLWTLLRGQWDLMDRSQREAFRKSLVELLGYPVLDGDERRGAQVLLSLPEDALSQQMRKLLLPKIGIILEQLQDIPTPDPALIGYLIYDY